MSTKQKPGKFDCYANALPSEEMFILLARDAVAPEIIRAWCRLRIANGHNKPDDLQIADARACAERMEAQRDDVRAGLVKRASTTAEQRGGGTPITF